MAGGPLARRRRAEVERAAKILGVTSEVLDNHDGELMPTLENRKTFVRLIREWRADIVIGHRPNDYHPDHRYTGILMQDAAYMVTVPFFCPDVPQLSKNPVFFFMSDRFQKPYPFEPDVVVSIDDVFERKFKAIWQFESQIESVWARGDFEDIVPIPVDPEKRKKRRLIFRDRIAGRSRRVAEQFRDKLKSMYGEGGESIKYAEAFEVCEYGRQPTMNQIKKWFLFDKEK
jgi:LmbE family N-acetylglucosaminyl deacetylase